ncbi:hypothetical protein [Micromonospora deserti]|uniref:Uncharacterized protein n=1 Tax=Micromonospora deserti TaxID=2070366 RepID=A0A2W2E0N2_9ACTN|nr:hypothetical protein [Micromonospora deserti]PZF98533.1 hypothetical protein C1I99_13310 [Micromonospora deserti]
MTGLLIATHDQAVHAIREHVRRPGVDELLRGVVLRVLDVHSSDPSSTGRPDPDCFGCQGRGWFDAPHGGREHCHCRCPWCLGCEEPLCFGPCPTVEVIVERLDLTASTDGWRP